MPPDPLSSAVERGDPDELLRLVDRLAASSDWDGLVRLAILCRAAMERGKQLWGVAEHIDYRLALEAPGRWAGPAVVEGTARFTLGPLHEVAASSHGWAELAPHLPPGLAATMTGQERVLRGEDLTGEPQVDRGVLEVSLRLEPWEPRYPVATYHADRADFPSPPTPPLAGFDSEPSGQRVDDPAASDAMLGLVRPWTESSNGRAEAVAVAGGAMAAVTALGARRARIAAVAPAEALAWMGWAAASGGAHGRRRGAAVGRFEAWWAAATLAGLDWPVEPDHLGEAILRLRWFIWGEEAADTGWALRLAVENPGRNRAWAMLALDAD